MKRFTLFIDESGTPDTKTRLPGYYILCGCVIAEDRREELKNFADQIKFKYWGRTDIVFHSREISRNAGDFSIFQANPELKKSFYTDLLAFIDKAPVIVFPVIVDKTAAVKLGWDEARITKEPARRLILNFIHLLLTQKDVNGSIIVESSSFEKDKFYLETFGYFISPDVKELKVSYKHMQKVLTSLSYVTKNNHDIEEQITDLFAYAAYCKFMVEYSGKGVVLNPYETQVIALLDKKMFDKPHRASSSKMEYFSKIDTFCVLPAKPQKQSI
jgi:Protein of unknown function (DUF3800)